MSVVAWLGHAQPIRSVRWLDGALRAATGLGSVTAVAAGGAAWLDLAADRASRAGAACAGISTDQELDYLGWAQVVAAVARSLGATTIIVDEASRPERSAEVAAIAELLDAAQLTRVVELTSENGDVRAHRVAGDALQTVRVRGKAVIGVRIAGPMIDEYPTPAPSAALRRLDLKGLGLDPAALAHRAVAPRATTQAKPTIERIADHVAMHLAPRGS